MVRVCACVCVVFRVCVVQSVCCSESVCVQKVTLLFTSEVSIFIEQCMARFQCDFRQLKVLYAEKCWWTSFFHRGKLNKNQAMMNKTYN